MPIKDYFPKQIRSGFLPLGNSRMSGLDYDCSEEMPMAHVGMVRYWAINQVKVLKKGIVGYEQELEGAGDLNSSKNVKAWNAANPGYHLKRISSFIESHRWHLRQLGRLLKELTGRDKRETMMDLCEFSRLENSFSVYLHEHRDDDYVNKDNFYDNILIPDE